MWFGFIWGFLVNKGTDLLLCAIIATLKKSIKTLSQVIALSSKHTMTLPFSEYVKVSEYVNCLATRVLRDK